MNRWDCVTELAPIIEREAATAAALLDALLREKKALAGSDAVALAETTDRKNAALTALEVAETERRRVLQRFNLGSPPGDMQVLIEKCAIEKVTTPAAISIASNWKQLRTSLLHCRDANLTNGQIVATMQRRVQQALNLLRGGRGEVATYGRTGSTQLTGAGARELARA